MKRFRDLLQKARQNLKTSEHNISLSTTEKIIWESTHTPKFSFVFIIMHQAISLKNIFK